MSQIVHPTDLTEVFAGPVVFGNTVNLGNGVVTNANLEAGADIDASKQEHHHVLEYGKSGTPTSETVPLHLFRGAATISQAWAGLIGVCTGASNVTIDIKKNGTSILSAVITLDSGNAARGEEQGTITTTTAIAGDWLEAVIVATAAGTDVLGTGLLVHVSVDEAYPT